MMKQVRLQICRQKGKLVEAVLPMNGGSAEEDGIRMELSEYPVDGCRLGKIQLHIDKEPLAEPRNLALEAPVKVYLPMLEHPQKITAMYMYNPWWTRPAFVEHFQDIPDQTQVAFFQYRNRCACFVPMVGSKFKTYLTGGTETELCLEMTAGLGGQSQVNEPLYLFAEAPTTAEAVHKAFTWLAKDKGIRLREDRRIPEMFRYLGWCSWDAFKTEVTANGIRQKAQELKEKHVPVRWMLIDDGWFSAQDKQLYDFAPDPEKFPKGFKGMTADIKAESTIRWFGVWHALGGYWDGIASNSPLAAREAPYLYQGVGGALVPSPETGSDFYDHWYKALSQEGIDFVKVDGQSSAAFYFENSLPLSAAVRGISEALERGAYRMDNSIINCMGMAMENILARPVSALSRNSDDFVPDKENGFVEHLLQNAYNAIYHNEIYCCDWDMFWTKHPDAVKHSLLRAISGGPVYFSDRVGDTVPEVLKALAYKDGQILMMDRSAKPTEDCVFSSPMKNGVLKLHNVAPWGGKKGGGIAAYNLTKDRQTVAFTPADIPDLEVCERYWVLDYFRQAVRFLGRDEEYKDILEGEGVAWYVILPDCGNGACFGLVDKYVGFSAVESVRETGNTTIAVLHAAGTMGWASHKPPEKVTADASDLTDKVERRGDFYTLTISETTEKAILSITW